MARQIIGDGDFNEIFVFCPLEVCQSRDPNGLYEKATSGSISNFTGTQSPYQPPAHPTLRIDTSTTTIDEEVGSVFELLSSKGVMRQVEYDLPVNSDKFKKQDKQGRRLALIFLIPDRICTLIKRC